MREVEEVRMSVDVQRFLLNAVSWQAYEKILDAIGDQPIRLTFDRGKLEIMSPSYRHESGAYLTGRLVDTLTFELDIPIKAGRTTTFRRKDLDRGLEADNCYWVQNAARMRGRKRIDLARDPPPDLAIEVEISRGMLDRLGIYVALGIPEIWRFDGVVLRSLQLRKEGKYEVRRRSLAFPFLPLAEVGPLIVRAMDCENDTESARLFQKWVRERVAPLFRSGNGA